MRLFQASLLGAAFLVTGCHSAVVDATLTNATDKTMQLIEVDYPSASFGTQSLTPGGSFHYRFKILGSGPMKLSWTDAAQKDHAVTGPVLTEGTEGKLSIVVAPDATVAWRPALKAVR